MSKGKRKSLGGNGTQPMIGGSAAVPANRNTVSVKGTALGGVKAGKAKRGKRSSNPLQQPIQGGYS